MRSLPWWPLALVAPGALACFGFLPDSTAPGGSTPSVQAPVQPTEPPAPTFVDTTIRRTSRAYFPLSVGLELTYDELESRGAGDRVLFMTERPSGTKVRGEWRFTITGVDETVSPAVYSAVFTRPKPPPEDIDATDDASPVVQNLRLWMDGDRVWMDGPGGTREAVTIAPGPPVVGSEEVECTLRALGGLRTTCRAVGGIGGDSIGATHIFLDYKNDLGNAVGRTLIGIATLGTIIPASKRRSWQLEQTLAHGITAERELPDLYRAWTEAPPEGDGLTTLAELTEEHLPDAASLAAIVTSQPIHAHARTVAAMDLLPPNHRAPVLREALRTLESDGYRSRILLLGEVDGAVNSLPRSHRDSVVQVAGGEVMASGARLASNACPAFEAALREPESVPWSEAVRIHMAGKLADPACDEAALGVPHDVRAGPALLDLVMADQPDARWGTRLRAALEDAEFSDRLSVLERYQERARQLPEPDRESLTRAFTVPLEVRQARTMLGLAPAESQD